MTEISFSGPLRLLQKNPYGRWLGYALAALAVSTLLTVVASAAGVLWATLLMGALSYASLGAVLVIGRRAARAHRREGYRSRT
ncbi:hypothetical protein Sme01_68780 [Sphaerisporangium melleum]|uniref:Uncharacterized protein n=1 Tax=Sphaerisporangium melleum TaxID=321316 RepID=A0A917VRR7_9ACTN|nr:hypothetical protein [Sphaerisporangium melleum]GGL12204.1 hypothetical protein GCM10007964_62810 [Sphaerisporangium melleum]GII74402.1 hypothetical protein Sme01_68780 [Sphaerisporangium melleum]